MPLSEKKSLSRRRTLSYPLVLGHYLPQMYLNRFAASGRIHVFDRETGKLRRDRVRNVAAISDYYVLTSPTGERNDSVETRVLSDLESAAAPALARLGRCEAISDQEHGVLSVFFAILCTRVPAFEKAHALLNDSLGKITFRHLAGTPERAAKFLTRRRQTFPYKPEEFAAFVNSERLNFPLEPYERLKMMIEFAEPLVAGFEGMDWWLLRAKGRRRFITSDAPVGFIPLGDAPPTYGELTAQVLKLIAIDPEICLMLAERQQDLPFLTCKEVGDDDVGHVNTAIARAAVRLVIGRDEKELSAVLEETDLRNDDRHPATSIVVWDDELEGRSFMLSVRVHYDTKYPLELPIEWRCESCHRTEREVFAIAEGLIPVDPHRYSRWRDTECSSCTKTPRQTGSRLSGEEPFDLTPPADD